MSGRQRAMIGWIRRRGDAALGVGAAAILLAEYSGTTDLSASQHLGAGALSVLAGIGVALRHRAPLVLLAGIVLQAALQGVLPAAEEGIAWAVVAMIAIYTVASTAADSRRKWAGAAMTAALPILWLAHDHTRVAIDAGSVVGYSLFAAVPWAFGRVILRRRARERALEGRTAALERESAETARRAVEDERARLAREIHDVVGHALGLIVVQAEGGGRMMASDPEEAGRALDTISRTGREALTEMRRLVGLLRVVQRETGESPLPGLGQIDALAERMRAAGLPVDVIVRGAHAGLAPSVDLSAYRVAQEALTNVLRHAGPAHARLLLTYGDEALEISVTDDGAGAPGEEGGHGLLGIRERVGLLGGEVEAGPRDEGGFAVRARIPYAPPA